MDNSPAAEIGERIAAWRRRGAQRVDPLGFALIESMASRAASHDGAARRLIDQRLHALLEGFAERFERLQGAAKARRAPRPVSPLAALREQCSPAPAAELKAVQQFRADWTRLRTEQRLHQSLARAPEKAGPLNSHALLLRTLQQLQGLSPAYLDRFVGYAETLLAIDQAGQPAPLKDRPAARPRPRRAADRP